MEPTEEQLALGEVLLDMKEGEIITVRGIHSKQYYYIVDCDPFVGRGKVTIQHPGSGKQYVEDLPEALSVLELVAVEVAGEYMVSVDGMAAPKKVHATYDSACEEADRLARKHLGNRVRVLKVEHVIMGKQHVEVKECR